jgi:hypothetical protein
MKWPRSFSILLCFAFAFPGCTTHGSLSSVGGKAEPGNRQPLGYPVDAQSSLVLMDPLTWWPELSGYSLPAGVYAAEDEDTNGVFFKAPDGFKLESVTGATNTKGGIYLPKSGTVGVRGHVYLWMPVFGGHWESYLLPDQFFSHYGKTWRITQTNQQSAAPQELKDATP